MKSRWVRAARRAGMSLLLEAVIGFGLLATCMLLIFGMFPSSQATLAVAKDRSIAINLAREKIEERRVAGFSDPRNAVAVVTESGTLMLDCTINGVVSGTNYTRETTVTAVGTTVKLIKVEVWWKVGVAGATGASQGMKRSVVLETYVTKQ